MNRRRAPRQFVTLYWVTGLLLAALWLTGMAWLGVHYFATRSDQFGMSHHPVEAPLLLVHGVAALTGLFVLGWFAARHAGAMSGRRHSRVSGWLLAGLLLLLAGAGCAQFFLVSDTWQAAASLVHEICGAALLLPVLMHLLRFRNADRERARDGAPDRRHHHGPRTHSVRN